MEEFLRRTKSALEESSTSNVHVVLGNESCDLDSAAAALTYAFYLDSIKQDKDAIIIPMLNIPSADLRLRTEVTYYFDKVHVPLELLTFRDQIDLSALNQAKRLRLTLVDLNVLTGDDKTLEEAVVEVIDHHQRDRPYTDNESVLIELVGSCCTLVAEILTTNDAFQVDAQVAELLYGVVLLDTVNLLEEAGRTTPKDILMVDLLEGYRANDVPSRQVVFTGIEKAKADVSGLSMEELLRKDMKALTFPNLRVVFSSLPLQMEEFICQKSAQAALQTFSEKQEASLLVIMTLSLTEAGHPERQIAVFSHDSDLRAQCVELLQNSTEPELLLSPLASNSDLITAFSQGNVTASRKKILPYIKTNISKFQSFSPRSEGMISPSHDSGLALDSPDSTEPSDPTKFSASESPGEELQDPFQPQPPPVASLIDMGGPEEAALTDSKEVKKDLMDSEDEASDAQQPASTQPGGLLDLDFFEAPVGDHTSEAGSLGSLDDYAEEQDIELVPAHSHGKMLELISDALQESTPNIEVSQPFDSPKRVESESDLFEHHEGVLIGPSPVQGTTPDCNLTPDTSQPTSPPTTSYPSTPPNSYIDSSAMDATRGHLPSFMNADMVRLIEEKKATLSVIDEDQVGRGEGTSAYPFTPQNSASGSLASQGTWERGLPAFSGAEMIQAVQNKRKVLSGFEPHATSDALKFPYTPPNSFVDSSMKLHGKEQSLREEDLAARLSMKKAKVFDELEEGEEVDETDGKDENGDIHKLVNPQDGNVVAYKIAQEMKAKDSESKGASAIKEEVNLTDSVDGEEKDIHKLVNPVDGNVVAHRIAEEMREQEKEIKSEACSTEKNVDSTDSSKENISKKEDGPAQSPEVGGDFDTDLSDDIGPDSLLPSVPKSETLELISNSESLQAELAEAEEQSSPPPSPQKNASLTGQNTGGLEDDKDSSLKDASRSKNPTSVELSGANQEEEEQLKERLGKVEGPGRATSESFVSEASTDDSDLSQGIQDLLSRMRSDTGASLISGNSEDLLVTARHIEVAKKIVDEAISSAVDVVKEDSPVKEELAHAGEWDSDKMNKIHEAAMLDTASSTSQQVDEMNSNTLTQRPVTLQTTPKKKIVPNLDLLRDDQDDSILANASVSSSEGEPLDSFNDLQTPDDLTTPEAFGDSVFEGELDWEESENSDETPCVEPIPEYTAKEEFEDEKNWRTVTVGDREFRIDMKVIEPYKKVLSHGGYYGDGFNAIIVFAGCYLPDKRRRDYHYVMDNLFLYVLSTLELLVVEDYMVVYFHGATPKQKMPSLRWLKRCYDMIDRRLRKNLKSLLIVHPTLWIRTIMALTKPFISSKFSSKLKYVRSLKDLEGAVPMEYVFVPDEIKMFDAAKFRNNPPSPTAT